MFLDGISSVVLTMAIVEPMIRQAGIDLIWFGVFIVVMVVILVMLATWLPDNLRNQPG